MPFSCPFHGMQCGCRWCTSPQLLSPPVPVLTFAVFNYSATGFCEGKYCCLMELKWIKNCLNDPIKVIKNLESWPCAASLLDFDGKKGNCKCLLRQVLFMFAICANLLAVLLINHPFRLPFNFWQLLTHAFKTCTLQTVLFVGVWGKRGCGRINAFHSLWNEFPSASITLPRSRPKPNIVLTDWDESFICQRCDIKLTKIPLHREYWNEIWWKWRLSNPLHEISVVWKGRCPC